MVASTVHRPDLDRLLRTIRERGYEVIGPTVIEGAIGYSTIGSTGDLPVGIGDVQAPGSYSLTERDDGALFGYVVGPHSWKRHLRPPREAVWVGRKTEDGVVVEVRPPSRRYAFFGVRPCELAAIAVLDRTLLDPPARDGAYASRRADMLVIAVNCTDPADTCFCTSFGTGPTARSGFDLAITELVEDPHRFVVEAGSPIGDELLVELDGEPASSADIEAARSRIADGERRMWRHLDVSDVHDLLIENAANGYWEEIAARCLTCANCTLVCPTCFCVSYDDTVSLDGVEATRTRTWDSCFTLDFTYLHGGSVRSSPAARYRQWLTHKLATWQDQFGVVGCVGCGRCITWCPVGIDLTHEVAAFEERDVRRAAASPPSHEEVAP